MQSALAVILGVLAVACADPVHDRSVEALGPETAGVPHGPNHRPGQPCLTCHGGDGPANLEMSFGGTVYAHQTGRAPAAHVVVRIVDADLRTYETETNAAGNFWVPTRAFEPRFPVSAAVTLGQYSRVMRTAMRLDGSCNGCHALGEANSGSPGYVWVLPDSADAP